jgi:spore maturation protein CgeB
MSFDDDLQKLKSRLKENKFVYKMNAVLKNKQLVFESELLAKKYDKLASKLGIVYSAHDVNRLTALRLHKRGLKFMQKQRGSLRLFWVGANREQDYSGFLQALQRFGAVTVFKGPKGSTYGLDLSRHNDPQTIEANSAALLSEVMEAHKNGGVDILFGQMWANYLSVDCLKAIQALGIATVNVAMDDRLPALWKRQRGRLLGSIGLVDGLDLVLNTSEDCCIRYQTFGCPALYWPLASDPDMFKPAKIKDIEVCFVGSNYGIRGQLISTLQNAGIPVTTFGNGWPNGPIPTAEVATIFGRSKIILGIGTIGYSHDRYTLKLRDFEATMSGALYVTHRNPDLESLFQDGLECAYYESPNEAVSIVSHYLRNEGALYDVGAAAAKKARDLHTWDIRFNQAFDALGVLPLTNA